MAKFISLTHVNWLLLYHVCFNSVLHYFLLEAPILLTYLYVPTLSAGTHVMNIQKVGTKLVVKAYLARAQNIYRKKDIKRFVI